MTRNRLATALLGAALIAAAVGCAPPPPVPKLVVTTTAETFDGVCDDDCSLRDALAQSNSMPPNPGNVPNQILLPPGTYAFTSDAPLEVTKSVVITASGASTTTFDLSGSPLTAPTAVFDVRAPLVMADLTVSGGGEQVLASCSVGPRPASLVGALVDGLAAVTAGTCDAFFGGTEVVGDTAVLSANSVSATGSTLPFASGTLSVASFTFVNSVLTGPSAPGTASQDAVLSIQAPSGIPVQGSISASRLVRVGLELGGQTPGAVNLQALASSFHLDGLDGPLAIDVAPGSTLQLRTSTVVGGGPLGALQLGGTSVIEASTIASGLTALAPGDGSSITVRRSIVSSKGSTTCTAPVTSAGFNAWVGPGCGTPSETDQVAANEAALELSDVGLNGSALQSYSMVPSFSSPLVDAIPPGLPASADCPVENGEPRSLDQRGVPRPFGAGCDIGAIEAGAIDAGAPQPPA